MTNEQAFILVCGTILTLIGVIVFFLLAWFKKTTGESNVVKILQAEFRLSNPGLVMFILGMAMTAAPSFLMLGSSFLEQTPSADNPPPSISTPQAAIATPTPRPSPTPVATPTPRPSPTPVATPTPRPSPTPVASPTPLFGSTHDLKHSVEKLWKKGIDARIAAYSNNDPAYAAEVFRDEALSEIEMHIAEHRDQDLVLHSELTQGVILDIREINDNTIEVDTCETWAGSYSDLKTSGIDKSSYMKSPELVPLTITIEKSSGSGPEERWFITQSKAYLAPHFCIGLAPAPNPTAVPPTPSPTPPSGNGDNLEHSVEKLWKKGIDAQIAAHSNNDSAYAYEAFRGEALSEIEMHIASLRDQGLVWHLKFIDGVILNIREISSSKAEVDTCETWAGSYYNIHDGALVREETPRLVPLTITMQWLVGHGLHEDNSGGGFFITQSQSHEAPHFCSGIAP
jgi:hypothetical protein